MTDKVAHRIRQVPVIEVSVADEGSSSSEEELVTAQTKKKALKSSKWRTANSLVLHNVM